MLCELLLSSKVIQLHTTRQQSLREEGGTSHSTTSVWLNSQPKLLITKDKSGKMIYNVFTKNSLKSKENEDFLGGPGAKTSRTKCRGPVFDPWSENQIPRAAIKTWQSHIHK